MSISDNPRLDKTWEEVKSLLFLQMTKATYQQYINRTSLLALDDSVATLEAQNAMAAEWLRQPRIKQVAARAFNSILGGPVEVVVTAAAHKPGPAAQPEEPGDDFVGVYRDKRNEIIRPDFVEVHTQYFRRYWRPKLGPLLSELVRELRQRCYYGRGQDPKRRPTVNATYKELAAALGVSDRTIKRALQRDDAGNFANDNLHYFIKDMQPIHVYTDGRILTVGTRFTIWLDEELTPEDLTRLDGNP